MVLAGRHAATEIILNELIAREVERMSRTSSERHHAHTSHRSERALVLNDLHERVHDARVASSRIGLQTLHSSLLEFIRLFVFHLF